MAQCVKGLVLSVAVGAQVWFQHVPWELSHAAGVAKKNYTLEQIR